MAQVQINLPKIPFSSPDLIRPFGGPEEWHRQYNASYPSSNNRQPLLDNYRRFGWTQLEGSTQGSYNFSLLESEIRSCMDRRQKFDFGGVMIVVPGGADSYNGPVNYAGASSLYPLYVHNGMQSESVKDKIIGGTWVPNWTSNFMLTRFEALLQATANFINNNSYKPAWSPVSIPYKNAVNYIDIRGIGSYGEWHHGGIVNNITEYGSMAPTASSLIRFVNAYKNAFTNKPLVALIAAFDAGRLNHTKTPAEVAAYILLNDSGWGKIGFRRDQQGSSQWNDIGNYVHQYLDTNTASFGTSGPFNILLMDRYKFAPNVGEPENNGEALPTLLAQAEMYKTVSVGDGNYSQSVTADNNMRAAGKRMGHRLFIDGGSTLDSSGSNIIVTLNWKNDGITPTYEKWDVVFIVKNSSGQIVATKTSSFKPFLFLGNQTVTDTIGMSVAAGTYSVHVSVNEDIGYRLPYPLYNEGRSLDGSYNLGSVVIAAGVPNNPPTANAGVDKEITLPESSVFLVGAGSDSDGDVTKLKYLWEKVSGPATGGTIQSPTTAATSIQNLVVGLYSYRLTVTDDRGATAFDFVNVNVLPEVVNIPPTVDAGDDLEITSPDSVVRLQGEAMDADGTFTVLWTKISGSGAIAAPNSLTSQVTDLLPGTSEFQLTVTDNKGASASDRVNVVVNDPAPVKTLVEVRQTSVYNNGEMIDSVIK